MAIINSSTLSSLTTAYSAAFNKAFSAAGRAADPLAMVVPSSTKVQDYSWLGHFPRLREWIGDRTVDSIKQQNYTLTNKKFESTVGVPRDAIEDDQYGVYSTMIAELGVSAKLHMDELVFGALKLGDSTECYDGQNFFDTDHPVGRSGEEVNVANRVGTTGTRWWLVDAGRMLKPIIFQQRLAPEFQIMTDFDDEAVFTRDEFRYGVRTRCVAGYGLWQTAFQSQNALTAASFEAAYEAMLSFSTDEGRPLGIVPTHLVVPTSLWADAKKLIERDRVDGGDANIYHNRVQIIASAYLN